MSKVYAGCDSDMPIITQHVHYIIMYYEVDFYIAIIFWSKYCCCLEVQYM